MKILKAVNLKRVISVLLSLSLLFLFTSCKANNESTLVTNNDTSSAGISTSEAIVTNVVTTEKVIETVINFDIVGMWQDKDGTTRIFSSDGTCQNIAKIDIGGPAPVYTLSKKVNNNGYYLLYVSQSGYNGTTFYMKVISNDEIQIYENQSATEALYNLTRR